MIDADRVLGEGSNDGAVRRRGSTLTKQAGFRRAIVEGGPVCLVSGDGPLPQGKRGSLTRQKAFKQASTTSDDTTATATATTTTTASTRTTSKRFGLRRSTVKSASAKETSCVEAFGGRRTAGESSRSEADDVVGELVTRAPRRTFSAPMKDASRPRLIDAGAQAFVSEMFDPEDCYGAYDDEGMGEELEGDLMSSLTELGLERDPCASSRVRRVSCGLRPRSCRDPSLDGMGGPDLPPAGEAPKRPSLIDADSQIFVSELFSTTEEGAVPVEDPDPDADGSAHKKFADRLRRASCGFRPRSFLDPSLNGPP